MARNRNHSSRSRRRNEKWVSRAGFALVLVVVGLALLGWRVPGGDGSLGADVIFAANPSGELAISPIGPFITVAGLEPSGERQGAINVKNQTGSTLAVKPRAAAEGRDLDRVLRVELKAADKLLFSGPLGGLRNGTSRAFVLTPGQTSPLDVRIWLPPSIRAGYQGRIASVHMELRPTPVES